MVYQHFVANKLTEEKTKTAILLSSLGPATYKLLRDLSFPALPKEKTFDELCAMLNTQYNYQMSTWKERRKFFELKQIDESVTEWYAKVRKNAVNCQFAGSLTEQLKNKFVTGINSGRVFDRMCDEESSQTLELLTIEKKIENQRRVN